MCGISGWFSTSGDPSEARRAVQAMVERQRHRGPDDEGIDVVSQQPVVVLGHNRLSIIDVTPDGHQPMRDPETGNVIVFNGEIYNFKSLRHELAQQGESFRTQSDTEVILKAYAVWDEACCKRFRGIFAFAIWDEKKKRLFVARDHLGVKPFYYCQSNGGFAFASEVRALLASKAVKPVVDPCGLNSFFTYGSVQEPFTMIKGVCSLPAGHCGVVSGQKVEIRRYWNAVASVAETASFHKQEEALDAVTEVLKEAVSLQMIADVPLGAFLSGGIDSSAVVSLMRQTHQGPIKTFSIVFDVPQFDERQYASAVAKQNGTEHVELELSGRMAQAHLTEALEAFDQPSMDGLNTWFVSRLVKQAGLTVALSGVGGDELFVGYGGFAKPLSMMQWQKRIGWLPAGIGASVAKGARSEKLRKCGQLMGYPLPAYFLSRQVFSADQTASLLNQSCCLAPAIWQQESFNRLITDGRELPVLDQISLYELGTYMLSTLLRDTDQMSMAHSLEVRVPLIDHRVVETMLAVPFGWKRDARTPKPLLVHAAGKGLPASCVYRPKQGFVLPFESWFKGCMKGDVEAFCQGSGSEVFNPAGLRSLWKQYELGHIGWSRIWGLFVLNHWLATNKVTLQ